MTDVTLAVVLPLLGAFLLPMTTHRGLQWLGVLLGPGMLAIAALLLFAAWSAFDRPYAIALGGFAPPLGIAFYVDRLALLFAIVVPLGTLLLWPGGRGETAVRQQSLTLLLAASLTGLALSGDLFNLYVFYELAAVASYGLIAGNGRPAALIAGFRYLLISALGSVVALLGIALVYFKTGTLTLAHLATQADRLADPQGLAAFAMLLIGFGVKAELFPVNGWVPEVYATIDRRLAGLLAGIASKLAVLAVVRILMLVFPQPEARELLLVLGVLGVVTGELAAWQARDLTRLLAWSSIGQLGVVFVAFSLPGKAGVIAGVAAAMHHLVVKPALFLLAERWGGAIERLRGGAAASPLGAALFVLFALSLLGLPPLPGFWSKFLVLGGLAEAATAMHLVALAAILGGTVIEGAYLLRVIMTLYGSSTTPPRQAPAGLVGSTLLGIVLVAATLGVEPLWQQLNGLADSAIDVRAQIDTVLPGAGGTR